MMIKSLASRIVLTIGAFLTYDLAVSIWNPMQTLATGQLAGRQLDMTDSSYINATVGLDYLHSFHISIFFLLLALLAIWWQPLKKMFFPAIVLLATILGLQPAQAYYQKSDYTEPYIVLPNETAFWIPDVGDNKTSQTKLDSESYLRANKVQIARGFIPHTKLQGSGDFFNYVVPTGRLIIVDRSAYSREWVSGSVRGTSKKDQSFVCQSKEGLDITVGLSIGVYVTDDNAALFLSHFGVDQPKVDRTDPTVIFKSIYYGRSLEEVMDDRERPKVESLVCKELMARSLDDDNTQAGQILDIVDKNVSSYLATRGITLDFIGWADTFTFSPIVQNAIDQRYAADKITPVLDILKQKAVIDAVTKTGWNGVMPSSISLSWFPQSVSDWFRSALHLTPAQH